MKYYKNGIITEMGENEKKSLDRLMMDAQINDFRELLEKSDYKAIKYAEGVLTEEEYAETKKERQAWRARINELEALLADG